MSVSRTALLASLAASLSTFGPVLIAQTQSPAATPAVLPVQAADDQNDVGALIRKAELAEQRDRCYLYARAVRLTADFAEAQVASGNREAAAQALSALGSYTTSLETALTGKDKKLKDAEILLRESAFRLKAAMLGASIDDRPAMAAALAHVNAAELHVMGAVFAR